MHARATRMNEGRKKEMKEKESNKRNKKIYLFRNKFLQEKKERGRRKGNKHNRIFMHFLCIFYYIFKDVLYV